MICFTCLWVKAPHWRPRACPCLRSHGPWFAGPTSVPCSVPSLPGLPSRKFSLRVHWCRVPASTLAPLLPLLLLPSPAQVPAAPKVTLLMPPLIWHRCAHLALPQEHCLSLCLCPGVKPQQVSPALRPVPFSDLGCLPLWLNPSHWAPVTLIRHYVPRLVLPTGP